MNKHKILIAILVISLSVGSFPIIKDRFQEAFAKTDDNQTIQVGQLAMLQENSLAQVASPQNPKQIIKAVVTAYSSTPNQTDSTPFETAAGTMVRDGIIANNLLPFGTKVKIPDLYGDKIFVVEDRMNKRKGSNHFDIWFASTQDAKEFGVAITYIEVIEN
jgi:3D (Asp-Asp-Asp) domain-containing protein